ncbi:hypothetical protein GAPWK_2719 [Gilliamella apicola]|uniref:PTS mannose transporter subunit IIAB n=1 Tax=Gilliamella apicola TaxID=1196095 RepID=X2H896_9GAMM|nr:fructose PTS transporter subunit IIA [Gilliamella apicola]AHN27292.1 hypothetical protein GAPWK_2719 [Gilliamella apicola]PXV96545.1 PTS system IIA component (Fru family) [Gilliamella apicola]PXZ03642.1 PTS mannose transporter subunit IIAB [Gilliamella apicola]
MNLSENNIFLNLNVESRDELFDFLSSNAFKHNYVNDIKKTMEAFIDREKESSTGLIDGFAIPHAKDDAVITPTVFFAKLAKPIEWETFDESNVQYVFALFVPKNEAGTTHIMMISKLATALMEDDFKNEIKASTDINKIISLISKEMTREVLV